MDQRRRQTLDRVLSRFGYGLEYSPENAESQPPRFALPAGAEVPRAETGTADDAVPTHISPRAVPTEPERPKEGEGPRPGPEAVIDRVANTLSDIGTAWTTLRNRVQSLPATTRESFDAFVDVFGDAADTLAERGDQVRGTVRTLRSDTQQRWRTAIERSADALDAVRPTRRANPLVDNTPKENLTPAAKSHASREDKTEKVRQVITLAMTRAASSATGVATGPADAYVSRAEQN